MIVNRSSIVVGVDGSPASFGAVSWAAHEAAQRGCELHIMYTSGGPVATDVVDELRVCVVAAAAAARARHHALKITISTSQTPAANTLTRASAHAAMVVLGSRGRGGFSDLLLGSTARHVADHGHCPVMVVHHAERWASPQQPMPAHGTIVVGTDGTSGAATALEAAFVEAELWQSPLTAVRSWHDVDGMLGHEQLTQQTTRGVEAELDTELTPWIARSPHVRVDQRVEHGQAAAVLLGAARAAAMVVLGACGCDGGEQRLGAVAQQVLQHAPGAVLIVRGDRHRPHVRPQGTMAVAALG